MELQVPVIEKLEGQIPVFDWQLTSKCQLNCPHCFDNVRGVARQELAVKFGNTEMNTKECIAVLTLLRQWGVQVVALNGGEPLVRPDLMEILIEAQQLGFRIVLATNGVNLFSDKVIIDTSTISLPSFVSHLSQLDLSLDIPAGSWRGDFPRRLAAVVKVITHCSDADVQLLVVVSRLNLHLSDQLFTIIQEVLDESERCVVLKFNPFRPQDGFSDDKNRRLAVTTSEYEHFRDGLLDRLSCRCPINQQLTSTAYHNLIITPDGSIVTLQENEERSICGLHPLRTVFVGRVNSAAPYLNRSLVEHVSQTLRIKYAGFESLTFQGIYK